MIKKISNAFLILIAVTSPVWAETHEIIIDDTGFHPEKIEILAGDTVKWINKGSTVHSATGIAGTFDSGLLSPGLIYEHTFNVYHTMVAYKTEIPYGDWKDQFHGEIILDMNVLEISPRNSKFLDEQKITMTIFYPEMFYFTSTDQRGTVKVFYDEKMVFEGTIPELAKVLTTENSGAVYNPLDSKLGPTITNYITFSLPPFSLPPGIHKIAIEAEYEGKKFQDSVTYTVLPGGPADILY